MRHVTFLSLASLWIAVPNAFAQSAAVWAGANDNPNTLITAQFDGVTMSYLPEVASGGASGGGPGWTESQVRVFAGRAQGRCSLVAQTNTSSGSVAVYTIGASGAAAPVGGSPFATGGVSTTLAWARDGQALYVSRAVNGPGTVVTFRVACTPGGTVSVTNAGAVTLGTITDLRDLDVTAAGGHLCATGLVSRNVACFAIDPATRLPAATPANSVVLPDVRGLRLSPINTCGVLSSPSANLVRGLTVDPGGLVALTNSVSHVAPPFYGAISPDGAFAAFGTNGGNRVVLLNLVPAGCQISLAGITDASPGGGVSPYVAFDGASRLYVADTLVNRIRVFQATPGGPGTAISTSTTNHATANPPVGIDAALLSTVPVELVGYSVE
jgi:hypothetical protein